MWTFYLDATSRIICVLDPVHGEIFQVALDLLAAVRNQNVETPAVRFLSLPVVQWYIAREMRASITPK